MLRPRRPALSFRSFIPLLALFAGCGGDVAMAPPPPITLQRLDGTYTGLYSTEYDDSLRFPDIAWGGTVYFQGTFVLNIDQTGTSLFGTWTLEGTERYGQARTPVYLAGTMSGDLARGPDPAIGVALSTCGAQESFDGAVASGERLIRLSGRVNLADVSCDVFFTTPSSTVELHPQE